MDRNSDFGTRAIHAGQNPDQWDNLQVAPPISLTTAYKQVEAGKTQAHLYSRESNPTRDMLQENLAALEGAEYCRVFSSGLAACMSITNLVKTGEGIVCSDNVYGGVNAYLRYISVPQHGLQLTQVDMTDLEIFKNALKPNTRMVWFESCSNPLLKVYDIQSIVQIAKSFNKEIIVVVDNTFMTPFFQIPLKFDVDIVAHSVTKYLNGHTDVIMGAALTNSKELADRLDFMQRFAGAVPSAFDCYLVNRGTKTLHLRMERHQYNALAVARYLESNSQIERVSYPLLESHPQHELHKKQATGMSGMISFYLKGGLTESKKFFDALKLIILSVSLGGYETMVTLPFLMTHYQIPEADRIAIGVTENLIRMSVGLEHVDDIIADLDQALKIAIPL